MTGVQTCALPICLAVEIGLAVVGVVRALTKAALKRRGFAASAAEILSLDTERRAAATQAQEGLARRNEASKAIGAAMGKGDTAAADALKAEVADLKTTLPALEEAERTFSEKLDALLAGIPNLPADDVPEGADEIGRASCRERVSVVV